ncbi:MAG: CRISPR-associated endonuclease Cas1 [Oscillospiraceae bacterium]|jgi:CRISP-associated protein Cas1
MKKDLQELPKLRDSISYLYFEHAIIEQQDSSIVVIQKDNRIPVPVAALTCLMLGPGISITHAAIKALADNGCMVVWCGEHATRFYASGMGETRSAKNLLLQARLCMDEEAHMRVVRRMYEIRFPKMNCKGMTLQQIRGLEGIRVKKAYQIAAKRNGVTWKSRNYKHSRWEDADDINRALSAANSVLYSVCQASILSLGYSPALGFIHTGKMLSFVYDIGDLYKAETTIPAAFEAVKINRQDVERQARICCRKYFHSIHLMRRIAKDIAWIFGETENEHDEAPQTGELWEENGTTSQGGINYSREVSQDGGNGN